MKNQNVNSVVSGLNPYSNGLPSRGQVYMRLTFDVPSSLNPYSNGLPSRGSLLLKALSLKEHVLIPILMDYPLGDCIP